jgi:hypothetical protein
MYHRIPVSLAMLPAAAWILLCLALPAFAEDVPPPLAIPVGNVTLQTAGKLPEDALLDVGLAIFSPGIPIDAASHSKMGIFPEIRKAEAQFIPVYLRQVLVASGGWGVVRVLPDADASYELLITGKIRRSDGLQLVLQIRAADATGRLWLDKTYTDETAQSDYPVAAGDDPYADLYRQVANDLLQFRLGLSRSQLQEIREVALMRYAADLSQDAFGGYLEADAMGIYKLVRLPAQGDPMMARVERIRSQQHLFIDTVDEQYVDLYEEMAPTYNLWRQYGREQALYQADYQARASSRERYGRRGTFAAMEQTYSAYRLLKIQEQDLDEMALGFNNEVLPTAMEVSGRVFRLNGTLTSQYTEWRSILREIFALETGLPPASPAAQ